MNDNGVAFVNFSETGPTRTITTQFYFPCQQAADDLETLQWRSDNGPTWQAQRDKQTCQQRASMSGDMESQP